MFEQSDNNEWKPVTEASVREVAKEVYGDVDAFVQTVKSFNGMGLHLNASSKVRFVAG